jgi:serine/threonine-protein kinase
LFALVVLGATSRTPQAPSELPLSTFLPKDEGELEDAKGYYKPLFSNYAGKKCNYNDFERVKMLSSGYGRGMVIVPTRVYLAQHIDSGKAVVIKYLYSVSLLSIRMEEIVLHMLDHPNIPKGICTFLEDDRLSVSLVMEFTTENTFWKWMGTPEASDSGFLRNVTLQLVDVLGYLHDQNIVHNDIKPENILVLEDGTVKLIDYGLSTFCDPDGTTNGMGTRAYSSPEKLIGRYKNGADWFALAVTLVQLKNRKHPFGYGLKGDEWELAVSRGLPKSEDPIFDDFVQKIGHVDPNLRWSHANGNIDDIRNHPFLKSPDTVIDPKAVELDLATSGVGASLDGYY